jgi:hypothetical protein
MHVLKSMRVLHPAAVCEPMTMLLLLLFLRHGQAEGGDDRHLTTT